MVLSSSDFIWFGVASVNIFNAFGGCRHCNIFKSVYFSNASTQTIFVFILVLKSNASQQYTWITFGFSLPIEQLICTKFIVLNIDFWLQFKFYLAFRTAFYSSDTFWCTCFGIENISMLDLISHTNFCYLAFLRAIPFEMHSSLNRIVNTAPH